MSIIMNHPVYWSLWYCPLLLQRYSSCQIHVHVISFEFVKLWNKCITCFMIYKVQTLKHTFTPPASSNSYSYVFMFCLYEFIYFICWYLLFMSSKMSCKSSERSIWSLVSRNVRQIFIIFLYRKWGFFTIHMI